MDDPAARALYDDVRLATRAPLLAPGRAAAIVLDDDHRAGREARRGQREHGRDKVGDRVQLLAVVHAVGRFSWGCTGTPP